MVRKFAIVGAPRTGSSHLVGMLGGHPSIHCHGELFHPARPQIFPGKRDWMTHGKLDMDAMAELRAKNHFDFLDFCWTIRDNKPIVGFKIFRAHNDEILDWVLRDPEVGILVLYRQNFLAAHSSDLIAAKEKVWGRTVDEAQPEAAEQTRVAFDKAAFMHAYKLYQQHFWRVTDKLNTVGKSYLFINYEELNLPLLLNRLHLFFGLTEPGSYKPKFVKQNTSDILARFENAEEVAAFLAANGRPHWAYEGATTFDFIW